VEAVSCAAACPECDRCDCYRRTLEGHIVALETHLQIVTDAYDGLVSSDYEGSGGKRYLKTPEIDAARAILAKLKASRQP
jgi:hypothetical protein